MDGPRFDEVSRMLASRSARRSSVRVLGAAALAAVAGVLRADSGEAARGNRRSRTRSSARPNRGNSACAKFCARVFGEDTPEAGRCTSEAARGRGLCHRCGPAAPPGNGLKLCDTTCIPDTDCCEGGRRVAKGAACDGDAGVCVGGRCVTSNTGTATCVGADPCAVVTPPVSCGTGDTNCGCYSTVEGAGLCLRRTGSFDYPASAVACTDTATRKPCDTSDECGKGAVCAPLNALGQYGAGEICCPGRPDQGDKIGFCVDVDEGLCSSLASS